MRRLMSFLIVMALCCGLLTFGVCAEEKLHTDPVSDTTFTLSDEWAEDDSGENSVDGTDYYQVIFYLQEDSEYRISYVCSDLWGQQSALDKYYGIERSACDNSLFNEADVAEMLEISENKVELREFGENQYFLCEKTVEFEENGRVSQADVLYAVSFDNGWMYMFLYTGKEFDSHFADYEEMLASVQYPSYGQDEMPAGFIPVMIAFIVGIPLLVLLIVFIVVRKKKKARELAAESVDPRSVKVEMYYIMLGGIPNGPFAPMSLENMAKEGQVTPETMVCKNGESIWQKAAEVEELKQLFCGGSEL